MTPEGRVQAYAMAEFKKLSGLVRKIRYEGRNGCPDLLVILPGGLVVFVEVKTDERTGYVITDVDRDYQPEALKALRELPGTLRFRTLH